MGGSSGKLVALVDDEDDLRATVTLALQREGYAVAAFADGAAAWEAFEQSLPDLAILDILMPRMDGLELCRRLRALSESVPIIFLTSRDEEFDRVLGLELGADDYLCKPFSLRELAARIKVLFRRVALTAAAAEPSASRQLRRGQLVLDLQRYTATWNEVRLSLTLTEFMLLRALARHPGFVKTRRQLMEEGYPHDSYASDRTIDSHIKRLRRKLAEADPGCDVLETVHGLGYRFRSG
jgi:two-component system response regulator ChvI